MTAIKNTAIVVATGILLLVASCANRTTPDEARQMGKDKQYSGRLGVGVDPGIEPIIKQELEVFAYMYDSVQVDARYESEKEITADFLANKISVMILPRKLEQAEIEKFKENDTIYVRQIDLAYDAIAMIGNGSFDDSKMDVPQLRAYFADNNGPRLVFDSVNAGMAAQVLKSLGVTDAHSVNVYALGTVDEVIDYVEKQGKTIGFIPYSFVSDTDDDRVKKILHRVKILSLRVKDEDGKPVSASANQSDIAQGTYPLIRTIVAISRFRYDDNLDWLLMNFMYKEQGAKIFLKAGLIPAKMPPREIIVNSGPIQAGN